MSFEGLPDAPVAQDDVYGESVIYVFIRRVRPPELVPVGLQESGKHGQRKSVGFEAGPIRHVDLEAHTRLFSPFIERGSEINLTENRAAKTCRGRKSPTTSSPVNPACSRSSPGDASPWW